MFGEIVVEGDVAVGSGAKLFAVDGDGGVAIDAIEVDGDSPAGKGVGELEIFAILADASDAVAALVFLHAILLGAHFPGPIVGEGDGLPTFRGLTFMAELPFAHEGDFLAS